MGEDAKRGGVSPALSSVQAARAALAASLDSLDWRLLSWLLRYPFQRADDLVVGLARWTSRATVYRHLHTLAYNGLVGSVLPKTPAEGKRLYHLSNLGLHLLAACLGTPARTLARTYQTDEAGLLRLVPRLPTLLFLQDVVNGLVTHADDALTVQGRRPILVRWNWQRDLSHRFRYREKSRRLLVDGAVALCVRIPGGDGRWDEYWYGALLLATPLEDERVLRMWLERLLYWRECPERWKSYQHMLPVLVLARSLRQRDHWQRAMAQAAQQVGVIPLSGAIGSFLEREQPCNPWQLHWHPLPTGSGCHLRDLLHPVPETALPPALRPESDMVSAEGAAPVLRALSAPTRSAAMALVPTRLPRIITHRGAGHPAARPSQKQDGQEKQEEVDRREILAWLTWQLTPGAWQIIYLLLAHPLLSTEELAVFLRLQRHSVSGTLATLHRLGCIVPTRTVVGQRWYLDVRGLSLVAAANHVPLRTLAPGGEDSLAEVDPGSLTIVQRGVSWLLRHIRHTAGVYAFFAHLVQVAHQHQDHELCWWETEAVCERRYRVHEQWHNLRPDALADYQCGTRHFQFWLEWDRGTMNVRDLTVKFTAYAQYLASREWERDHAVLPLLLCVAPELAQEQRIVRVATSVLSQTPGLVLATTTQPLLAHDGPLAAIWQVSQPQQRGQKEHARRFLFTAHA